MYVVDDWKNETQMHLNVNHALLNNNMHKGISRLSKTLVWHILIIGWKTFMINIQLI